MSKLIIDDKFYIVVDANNWVLHYEKKGINKKTGKVKLSKDQWYYPNCELCLKGYVVESARKDVLCIDVSDLLYTMTRIYDNIESKINKFLKQK